MKLVSEEVIRGFPIFKKLSKGALRQLLRIIEIEDYAPQEIVYKEGDAPDYLYILVNGRVIATSTHQGQEVEIELIKKGVPFGVISLFTDEPHSVTARSIERSTILKIEKEKFRSFLQRAPLLALDFSQILSKRVKKRSGKPKKFFNLLKLQSLALRKGWEKQSIWWTSPRR